MEALADGWDRPTELAAVSAVLVRHMSPIGECVDRIMKTWPLLPSQQEMAAAMKSRDEARLSALRMLKAALMKAKVDSAPSF